MEHNELFVKYTKIKEYIHKCSNVDEVGQLVNSTIIASRRDVQTCDFSFDSDFIFLYSC